MSSKETQTNAAKVIRAIDSITPIIIAPHSILKYGTLADSDKGFTPVTGISNIWYEVHLYNFDQEFVNHKACYPGPAGGHNWNKDFLKRIISPAKTFQSTYGVKMYVGEFSIPVGTCGATQFLSDYIDLFEEYHWDWTYHAFREAPHLGHGGPGPQDSSFELVCQKLTSVQEDYRRYGDNAHCGKQHQGGGARAAAALAIASCTVSRTYFRIP